MWHVALLPGSYVIHELVVFAVRCTKLHSRSHLHPLLVWRNGEKWHAYMLGMIWSTDFACCFRYTVTVINTAYSMFLIILHLVCA